MKGLLTILFASSAVLIFTSCNSSDSGKTKTDSTATNESGWENLSDPKNLQWHTYGKDKLGSAWKVEDSTLHLDASVKQDWQTKDGGDIVSNKEYENFDLKLEWKISEGGNSGIMFYVKEDSAKYKYPWETGPEMQICDNEKNEDGKVYKSRAGDIYELLADSKDVIKPAGQWNQVEIIANNGKLDCNINGAHVISTTLWDDNWKKLISGTKFKDMPHFGTFKKGKIALQDHGADVWFRNIKIKSL